MRKEVESIAVNGNKIRIKFTPLRRAFCEAAHWLVKRREFPQESRVYLKDISVRKAQAPLFGVLEVVFEGNGGIQMWWRPKWEDVRDLFCKAYITEALNTGKKDEELLQFEDIATKVVDLSRYVHPEPVEGRAASTR